MENKRDERQIDASQIEDKITKIQGQLDTMGAVKTALKGASGKIDDASVDLRKMEASIREVLSEMLAILKTDSTAEK